MLSLFQNDLGCTTSNQEMKSVIKLKFGYGDVKTYTLLNVSAAFKQNIKFRVGERWIASNFKEYLL